METVIELYDREPILNVLASTLLMPKHVIFIGGKWLRNTKARSRIENYFKCRGMDIDCRFLVTKILECDKVIETLRLVITEFPDCVIDIAGGLGITLFAVGKFCAQNNIPVINYDAETRKLYGVNGFAEPFNMDCTLRFTVEQFLVMAGGTLKSHGHFSPEDIRSVSDEDIRFVWDIFIKNKDAWSKHTQYLQQIGQTSDTAYDTYRHDSPALKVTAPTVVKLPGGILCRCNTAIMQKLSERGIIENFRQDGGKISFKYKNSTIRRCLHDVGIWLELYTYVSARQAGCFDDVQISTIVDWEQKEDDSFDVINEIDVTLTKGLTPVFISCKISRPSTQALNEIQLLTKMFGGNFAKAVILTAYDMKIPSVSSTLRRAEAMGIYVIDINDLRNGELVNRLRAIAEK